jgi:hypothetical protein
MRITEVRAAAAIVCAVGLLATACTSSNAGTGHSNPSVSTSASSTPASTSAAVTTPAPPTTSSAPPSTSSAPATSSAPPSSSASRAPSASLSAFAGSWTGHSRYATISPAGVGKESVGDGCCSPQIDLTYSLSSPATSGGTETAVITVTAVTVHSGYDLTTPAPKVGDKGTLTVDNGVLTDSLTQITYCDPTQESNGTCGA